MQAVTNFPASWYQGAAGASIIPSSATSSSDTLEPAAIPASFQDTLALSRRSSCSTHCTILPADPAEDAFMSGPPTASLMQQPDYDPLSDPLLDGQPLGDLPYFPAGPDYTLNFLGLDFDEVINAENSQFVSRSLAASLTYRGSLMLPVRCGLPDAPVHQNDNAKPACSIAVRRCIACHHCEKPVACSSLPFFPCTCHDHAYLGWPDCLGALQLCQFDWLAHCRDCC